MGRFKGWTNIRRDIQTAFGSYVLAVSGGSDSMTMLDFVYNMKTVEFVVAHFNHGDRYELDDRDQKFVEDYCKERHIPIFIGHGDAEKILSARSLEMESRNQRYAFLKRVLTTMEYDRIMCGHTLSDQTETVLMRMLRGADFSDLIMKKDNGMVFRPFLDVTSEQVYENCRYRNIPWVEDETNTDTKRLRNWFRHEVLPLIATRCNPDVIGRTASKQNKRESAVDV